MHHDYIEDLAGRPGEEVTLKGWLYNRRTKGKIVFCIVRDGTGWVQCVGTKADLGDELFDTLDKLPYESGIVVKGTVSADDRAPGGVELHMKSAAVVSTAEEYPIQHKEHNVDFLLEKRHLWLRSKKQHANMRIRAAIISALREYLDSEGFLCIDSPVFTPAACEGTTTLFETRYFDRSVYLTQSGQLYNEATAAALGRVYCFGPTFRAEKSKTRRHLTEFWMLEPEMAYADMENVIALAEGLIIHVIGRVIEKRRPELETLERDISLLERVSSPFERVTYTKAAEMLKKGGFDFEWGGDFGAPEETYLSEQFSGPLVIHRWPKGAKAFYMKPDPENPDLVLGCDIIAPEGIGEIVGGGQRAESLEYLERQIAEHDLPKEAFEWYLDLRRFGSVPHGGFGLGLERFVGWICGSTHIREVIPFPRTIYRVEP